MNPLTMASTFATIVQLIGMFKQERTDKTHQDRDAFLSWLDEHRHMELKESIERNQELSDEIEKVLHEDHKVILAQLESINQMLVTLLSKFDGMGRIAHALHLNSDLSDQSISILRQLVASGAKAFLRGGTSKAADLILLSGDGHIEFDDFRFLDDDLRALVGFDLLILGYNRSGANETYTLTRAAVQFIEEIDREM